MSETIGVLSTKPHAEAIQSGIDETARKDVSEMLGEMVSRVYSLLIKTQLHHWNVVGPLFHPLHIMLEEQYEQLFESIDLFAERIRALGFLAPIPSISVTPATKAMSGEEIVDDLIADHEATAREMRAAALRADSLEDIVTHDMLVARMTWHEKTIWMLRAVVAK